MYLTAAGRGYETAQRQGQHLAEIHGLPCAVKNPEKDHVLGRRCVRRGQIALTQVEWACT